MLLAEIIVYTAFIYLAVGFLFSAYFSFFAVKDYDEAAKKAGIGFSLVIFFGVAAFWIYFAWRIIGGKKRPVEKNAHRKKAVEK